MQRNIKCEKRNKNIILEWISFRRIERLMKVIHIVSNKLCKKFAEEIRQKEEKERKTEIKTDILKPDKMCMILKSIRLWPSVDHTIKKISWF